MPSSEDGFLVNNLVSKSPPLDSNSIYCNLLQCAHFADTCVIAKSQGDVLGFVSAYRPPKQLDTLFIWQVAVNEKARGQGLASKMLSELINRSTLNDVLYIETTITPGNGPSQALFERFAQDHSAQLQTSTFFDSTIHFGGQHDSEILYRIGPLPSHLNQ